MKNLELIQMEQIEAGGFGKDFYTGACSGIAIASFAFLAGAFTFGAGAAVALGAAGAVCGAYAIME
ncbi:hypothetical protein LB456_05465 [Psychroflexus sp. CAK57W]|uniref:hypothetical protein n=1 Tax=Psychroflexus curvus TaxID=2873595 RepID=UPI001CD019C9|nr:hypothetical protein [Psychroflexus curvus]MBZ9786901.1 hypothetical protein [Psychroflexus curvus]